MAIYKVYKGKTYKIADVTDSGISGMLETVSGQVSGLIYDVSEISGIVDLHEDSISTLQNDKVDKSELSLKLGKDGKTIILLGGTNKQHTVNLNLETAVEWMGIITYSEESGWGENVDKEIEVVITNEEKEEVGSSYLVVVYKSVSGTKTATAVKIDDLIEDMDTITSIKSGSGIIIKDENNSIVTDAISGIVTIEINPHGPNLLFKKEQLNFDIPELPSQGHIPEGIYCDMKDAILIPEKNPGGDTETPMEP